MRLRLALLAALLVTPLARAETRAPGVALGRQLKAAMLHQPESVPVLIRWKPGRAGAAHRMGRAVTRELRLFQLTAARLSAARIEKLAHSRLVEKIYYDVE